MLSDSDILRYLADSALVELRHTLSDPDNHLGPANRWTGRHSTTTVGRHSDDAGLFAGRMWLLYLATGDDQVRHWAERITESLAAARRAVLAGGETNRLHGGLDLRFGLGLGYDSDGEQEWGELVEATGRAFVRSGFDRPQGAFVFELPDVRLIAMEGAAFASFLAWAGSANPELVTAFGAHLDQLLEMGFVRADGSCHQIAEVDTHGHLVRLTTYQGYQAGSTWARGQAWGMLAYLDGYDATGRAHHLETARRMADYWTGRTGGDPVPHYDFDDPSGSIRPRDSCAAAIAATVLLRLGRLLSEDRYTRAADRIVDELTSNYLGPGGALLHGSAGRPHGPTLFGHPVTRHPPSSEAEWPAAYRFPQEEVMPYGTYFYTEALLRRSRPDWSSLAVPSRRLGRPGEETSSIRPAPGNGAARPTSQFVLLEDIPWVETKAQSHDGRRVAVRNKIWQPDPVGTCIYTEYDPGMVIEEHGHKSNHFVFVLRGSARFGTVDCPAGSVVGLPRGATFGPIVAGSDGATLVEFYAGEPGAVPVDPTRFAAWLVSLGIEPLVPGAAAGPD